MNKTAKSLCLFLLPVGLFAASCSHTSATDKFILGSSAIGPLKFALIVSDPNKEESWTSDGKLLADYYNPELMLPEDNEARLLPAMVKGGFPNALRFFVVVQGGRKSAIPRGKVALDDPSGANYVFNDAGFDTASSPVSKDDLVKLPDSPLGLTDYRLPADSTQQAFASQPCIFFGQEFERFSPKSHTIRFAYSNQPWKSLGAYKFDTRKESGKGFIEFATPNIRSGATPSRELLIRMPTKSDFVEYRLLVKEKDGQDIHDLTDTWSMAYTSQVGSYVLQNGAFETVKRKGDIESIDDRNKTSALEMPIASSFNIGPSNGRISRTWHLSQGPSSGNRGHVEIGARPSTNIFRIRCLGHVHQKLGGIFESNNFA
ncbi:MAG TPA: hypothetical protein VGL56_11215 [Fimbriimonadaceae bacterium]|jgi:hypothetical protein